MKYLSAATALAAAVGQVSSHYIATTFAVGSDKAAPYEYGRHNTNNNSPVTCKPPLLLASLATTLPDSAAALTSNDLRCNVGGATGGNTTTIDIQAGGPFTFTYYQAVYHQGPISL